MNTFGSRFKRLRQQHNLTQDAAAKIFHVDKSSISKWENNKNGADNEVIQQIADYFNVSVDYLLGRTEEQKPSTSKVNMKKEVETIAAHLEGKDITPKKMKLLKSYIDTLFDDFDDE